MIKLFIDSNIYLTFYANNSIKYQELLKPLLKLKKSIFITEQIVNEVNRRKLGLACQYFDDLNKKIGLNKVNLPKHFDTRDPSIAHDLNIKRNSIEKNEKQYEKKFDEYVFSILMGIMRSEDEVSKKFNKIFQKAISPTKDQICNAEIRKKVGNPPGKSKNPIGDELNWIQLLDDFDGKYELWFVTNDSDYYSKYRDKLFLNSFLYIELTRNYDF